MSELHRYAIGASTRYCAVFGCPVRHSASPAFQNAGFDALGLDWRYLAFEVRPGQLRQALAGALCMHFMGVNLTLPHKLAALDFMDALDESATQWGAVNTIRFEARTDQEEWKPLCFWEDSIPEELRMVGFNTDADALVQSLIEDLGIQLKAASVMVLGAGGAGRMTALRLAREGVRRLWIVNRTPSKAADVAQEIRQRYPETRVEMDYPADSVDLLLNATSLGLKEDDPMPLDTSRISWARVRSVYDMIYQPKPTTLLACARDSGCKVANGLGMLLYQGAKALELWTGQPAPLEVMRRALLDHISSVESRKSD